MDKNQTKPKKKNSLRYNEYYGTQNVFDELYAKSKRNENFYKLYELIVSEENILLAFRTIKCNRGILPKVVIRTLSKILRNGKRMKS